MEETRFGDLLRRLRQAVDLSQEELAERAGLSMQTISALERGIRRAPYRHTIAALADALDLDEGDRSRLHSAAGRRHAGGVGPIVAQAAPRAVPPPAPDAPSAPETLPPALPDPTLIGRAAALAEATARLRGAAGRLLTIVGPGGVGKTRLALALAGAMTHEYADGATVVLLADLRDLTGVAAQVGRALGLPDRALDPVAALRVHLRERQILLILDNYEHLLPTAPLVADLLAAAPGLVVLATSRAPLRLRREEVYDLPPLACPDPAHPPAPEALADYGATALFVSRARAAYPDLAPTAADAATIAAICARLDGLPLALELAAARLNVLTPTGLLERLATRLPLLTRGARDLPERQRTLRAALDWSHDLLNAGEQALFRRLATFTGGATLVAIEAICAPPAPLEIELLDWLDGLVEQRLVRREGGDGESRFAMLETVREYAAERLAANAEDAATLLHRHSGYFLALAEEAASHLTGAKQERWTAILRADHDNLRAVLRRAIDGGDAATALRLAAALWRFWYAGGHWAEGRGWFRAVLALPSAADDATLTLARATILRAAGGIAIFQSDFGPAEEALRAALALARELGDSAGAATALDYLAILAKEQGDFHASIRLHEESLEARRALGVPRDIAVSLNNLGSAFESLSDYRNAARCYTESLALLRTLGDTHSILMALSNLGDAAQNLGDYARAQILLEEALDLARRLGEGRFAATALTALATLSRERGDAAATVPLLREALDLARSVGARICEAPALAELGQALRLLGEWDGAREAITEALTIATSPNDDRSAGDALLARLALAADAGDSGAALTDARAALVRFRTIDSGRGIAISLTQIGMLTADPDEAATVLREALERCVAMGHRLHGATALEVLAVVVADQPLVATLLAAAAGIRAQLGTPREPAWEARMAAAANAARDALGASAFAAARSAGSALDLAGAAALVVHTL